MIKNEHITYRLYLIKGNELCMSYNSGLVLNILRDSKILRSITFEAVSTMAKSSCILTLHENACSLIVECGLYFVV